MLFLDILAEFLAEDLLYNQVKDYLAIRKGDLKDSAFEKFYKTFVVAFVETHRWPDSQHAEKFFNDETTVDGVLAYLYRFAEPEAALREKTIVALSRWADEFGLGNYFSLTNPQLIERFLTRLETELRRDVNKSLLPYFGDILSGIAKLDEKFEGLSEQFEKYAAEQKARAERATQIDPSGEQLIVAGKLVYDSTQKVELAPALPVIRCDLEAIDEANHHYRAVITNEAGKELHKHNFTLKPDDAFLLEANHFLENDGLRDYRTQIALESDRTFTKRLGNHFYSLIMGANGALRDKVEDGALETGFQFVLTLDTEAELLWQVPWEYLHDSEEFLGLSGNVHVLRTPKGAGSLRVAAIPQPLKILVVVSNPSGEGEFDSERALAAIQEALDYSRRMGWVELDYLEEATFAHFQSRLAAFQPHVVHYIGHGGKNPPDAAAIQPPYSGKPGETYLAFANDDGEVAPLYGKALKRLLADTPSVQLLVLSGCMTGQTAFSDALAGAGTALLRESHVAGLVVMQFSILVDTAIQFAKVFYEAVGRGESLSRGLTHVRQVLAQSRGEYRADWGIPALYLRSPELQLVDPRAPRREVLSEVEGVSIGDLPVVAGFVGRTAELRQLRETVRHPQKPVIYIWGLGGIGKTTLTAKLIEKLQQEKAIEGHLVIRCDKIEPTFASVAEKFSTFISLQGKAGHAEAGLVLQDSRYDIETRVSLLNKAIKEQRYLIVFDNFESLFSEKAPQVGRISDAPLREFFMVLFSHNWRSTFLFTCRYQWDLLTEEPGMNRFTCNLPLANCHLLHLQGLSPAQTRMLMKNLPALSKLTFNQQNQVLPLLLGHPHTIRLCDAYLQQYGLEKVLRDEEISERSGQAGGLIPQVQTHLFEQLGEYFLDGLWSRLNEAEKDVLGLLSVFRTSLSEKALTQLITEPKALITVLNYSLLQRESGEDGPSYQVHPVVRGYVESKLDADKRRGYHLQAVEFYVSGHEDILSQFKEIDMPKPKLLAQITKFAAQQGQTQLAQTLTTSLLEMHHHLFAVSEYEQAFTLVNAIYEFLAMIGRREVAKALLRQSIASREGFNKYVAKGNLASLLNHEGKWQEAMATHQECIDYFASIGEKLHVAVGIGQQAQIYQERGEYEQALELERRAMEDYEEVKDQKGIARTHYRTAQLLERMERYDEALAAGEQALANARAINDQPGIANCLHQLGMTLNKLNRPREAFARFQESLESTEKIGDRAGLADTLGEMGNLLRDAGQFEAATNFFQRAITIYYELNNPVKVAIALEAIGIIFEQQGHFSEALEKYQETLRLMQQYGSLQHVAHIENDIARVKGKMKSQ